MIKSDNTDKKPLVGFFPDFSGIGETYPLIKIARRYVEFGGEVVFFSHGGEYEHWAKELGFEIIRIKPDISEIFRYLMGKSDEDLTELIENEASVYRNTGIKALVQTGIFFGCLISSRIVKIPLISVISGTWTPNYYKQNLGTFPDYLENSFTRVLPQYLKNRIFNWCWLKIEGPGAKRIHRLAKKVDIRLNSKVAADIILGDYNFACDSMGFLGLKPTKDFPAGNYIGPILPDDLFSQDAKLDDEVENHLKRSRRSILISLGSDYPKELFSRFLKTLNNTSYNVVAVYTTNLNENELPKVDDNILLKKFVPSMSKIYKIVDLAVIHGGRGTVYTAAYSGKPVIGIPNIPEQQFNLDCLVRHGSGLRLSKKYFDEKIFLEAIKKIFCNYENYLKNAQHLSTIMPKPNGDINAARRIIEILEQCWGSG